MGDTAAAIQAAMQQIQTPYQAETNTLGVSKLSTFLACPLSFKLRYEDRISLPHGAEAVLGTAIHAVIAHAHQWGWGPSNRRDAADMLVAIWESCDPEQMVRADDPAVELAYRSARDAWLPWYLHWSVGQQTEVVEHRWELEYEGIPLTGTIDRVYLDGPSAKRQSAATTVVSDIKSGKRAPQDAQLSVHLQLSVYDWAFRELAGDQPHCLEIVHLRGQATYRTTRTREYLRHVMDSVVVPAARMIDYCRETRTWPANTGTLYGCNYCTAQSACPVGQGGDSENGCS